MTRWTILTSCFLAAAACGRPADRADASTSDASTSDAASSEDASRSSPDAGEAPDAAPLPLDAGEPDGTLLDASHDAFPTACETIRTLGLPMDGASGTLGDDMGAFVGTNCERGPGPEHVYGLTVDSRVGVTLRDTMFFTTPGLSFSLRRACADASTELACGSSSRGSFLRIVLEPGEYFAVVDSYEPLSYSVALETFAPAANASCADASPIDPATPRRDEDVAAGGGLAGPRTPCDYDSWFPRLYYTLTVPARASAVVNATSVSEPAVWPIIEVFDSCAATTCVASDIGSASGPPSATIDNEGGLTARTVIVAVGLGQGSPTPPKLVDVTVRYEPAP